jgi:uncharacterized membrane-anchored protein YitT (DUF2179 family)
MCVLIFLLYQESFDMILVNNSSLYDGGVTVAMVGGTRPTVSVTLISRHLSRFYQVQEGDIKIYRYKFGSFLLIFINWCLADHVLHTTPLVGVDITLVFLLMMEALSALIKKVD